MLDVLDENGSRAGDDSRPSKLLQGKYIVAGIEPCLDRQNEVLSG